jgi:hypothetical protein
MPADAYVSLIGQQLRERGMSVSDLHRQLAGAGHRVSRAALDHLVTDQPIRNVNLSVLVPVLDLLALPPHDAFRPVDPEEAAARRRARAARRAVLRAVKQARRTGLSDEAASAYDDAVALAARALRPTHPELFDKRGRPLRRKIAAYLAERAGGQAHLLTEGQYAAVTERAARVVRG